MLRGILFSLLGLFVILNIIAAIQAYKLTHFDEDAKSLKKESRLSLLEKIQMGICGIDVPRPETEFHPRREYQIIQIQVDEERSLEACVLRTDSLKQGFVLLFHGYMEEKFSMLARGYKLMDMGYDVVLTDFMGAGGSYGNQTTIGYLEAENVKSVDDYVLQNMQDENIYLYGFSMGAAAITRAQSKYNMFVKGIVLEATYGTFHGTVTARFDLLNLPHFPMSYLLVFWGGVMNGFNPMDANPQEFAKDITVPALVMCGLKDPYISREETQRIFDNLGSHNKELKFFPEATHQSYLRKYPKEWKSTVSSFLKSTVNQDMY